MSWSLSVLNVPRLWPSQECLTLSTQVIQEDQRGNRGRSLLLHGTSLWWGLSPESRPLWCRTLDMFYEVYSFLPSRTLRESCTVPQEVKAMQIWSCSLRLFPQVFSKISLAHSLQSCPNNHVCIFYPVPSTSGFCAGQQVWDEPLITHQSP